MSRILAFLLVFTATALFSPADNAVAAEVVHYELKEWKAKHVHDAKKADTIAKTLKKLKCEVKQEAHNGHMDIKYRCVKQQDLPVKDHAEAIKWEKWFKEYGFKVFHTH